MGLPINTTEFWKERIEKSKDYGDIHHSVYISTDRLWKKIAEEHLKILTREVDPTWDVLDAGCGYGRSAAWFSPQRYTGVDFSPDFIKQAQERFKDHKFIQADLARLPFADSQFDIAFCISIKAMVIGNLGEEAWQKMEAELLRVADKVILLEYECSDLYTIL